MKTSTRRIAIAALAGVGVGGGVLLGPADARQGLAVEVTEDMTKFHFDDAPVFDDGMPAAGNAFVTQGYIYPEGTLAEGGGVNADGSPTHPDLVMGTWICQGIFIGDGARTETGAWVVTSQVFDFYELDGDDTIVSQGIEISDVGVDVTRPIVGSTGQFRARGGEQVQSLEGFNDGGGVNLSVLFDLDR